MRKPGLAAGLITVLVVGLSPAQRQIWGGGFEFPHQSAKAMAMGGAVVAQAEGPSALFYNVGALAQLGDEPVIAAGGALFNLGESLYQGLPPGVGAGTNGEQAEVQIFAPHAYLVQPLGDGARFGLGLYSPFMAQTAWSNPGAFAGRYLTTDFRLRTLDLVAALSYEIASGTSIGVGAIYRTSDLRHVSRLPSFDPAAGQIVDVADLRLTATLDSGAGWTAGILQQLGDSLTFGASYRSAIEIDYDGEARLTQRLTGNTALDALIASTLPLESDLSFRTGIEFPATAAAGLAVAVGEGGSIEVDANWTDWTSFDTLDFVLPNNSEFDRTLPQSYLESMTYRLGMRFEGGGGAILRLGASVSESPQPDETLGPLLPDGEAISYSAGFSMDWLDVAFVWTSQETRSTVVNIDDFNGTYTANSWVIGVTISE